MAILCRKLCSAIRERSTSLVPKPRSFSSIKWSELPVERFQDPDVLNYARAAVLHHNRERRDNLSFLEIMEGSRYTVSGKNCFAFTLKTKRRSIEVFRCRVRVKQLSDESFEVTFSELDSIYYDDSKDNICDSGNPSETTPEKD